MKHFYLTLFFVLAIVNYSFCQSLDSTQLHNDSTSEVLASPQVSELNKLLNENKLLNTDSTAVSFAIGFKKTERENGLFYVMAVLLLFFGILRTAYSRYFSTLFRVFFNSSLRQSQLTDQLLQSKLPSLYYNLMFLFASGFFIYLVLQRIIFGRTGTNWRLLGACVIVLFFIYLMKFILLRFIGWVTSNTEAAGTYIFIVFLINKIIGICLLPAVLIIAFANPILAQNVVLIYLLIIGLFLLLRYYRSYSLLQHKLSIGYFHFIVFIFAMEILPIMLIYRMADVFVVKNL